MPASPTVLISLDNASPFLVTTADLYWDVAEARPDGTMVYEVSREELAEVGAVEAPDGTWSVPNPTAR